MTIKRIIPHTKEVMSMFGIGFPGIEKDYPEQKSFLPTKRRKDASLLQKKNSTTATILQRG